MSDKLTHRVLDVRCLPMKNLVPVFSMALLAVGNLAFAETSPARTLPNLPAVTGECPAFVNGAATFSPSGMPSRQAQIYMSDAAKTLHGPLILYWHATGSVPAEAKYSLDTTLDAIVAAGGIVVAPQSDPSAGHFEWFVVNGSSKPDDFLLADEIVACAARSTSVDTNHIHSMGMSAGALQTTALSFMRSSYIASVVTYSGGMPPAFAPTNESPTNKFAALIFDGGQTDAVYGIDFQAASKNYQNTLKSAGHFAALCETGLGHNIPLNVAPMVAAFFQASSFGAPTTPFTKTFLASIPDNCSL